QRTGGGGGVAVRRLPRAAAGRAGGRADRPAGPVLPRRRRRRARPAGPAAAAGGADHRRSAALRAGAAAVGDPADRRLPCAARSGADPRAGERELSPRRPVRGTPAILALEEAGVPHTVHAFEHGPPSRGGTSFGLQAAEALGADPQRVFKTLVAVVDGALTVAVVPV